MLKRREGGRVDQHFAARRRTPVLRKLASSREPGVQSHIDQHCDTGKAVSQTDAQARSFCTEFDGQERFTQAQDAAMWDVTAGRETRKIQDQSGRWL